MERAGFILKVREEKIDEYKQKHAHVWPELLAVLRKHGWRNFSLFLRADGTIFAYVEAEETLEKAMEGIANEEVNLRWQAEFAPLFEIQEGLPIEGFEKLDHYFHLE